MFEKYCLHAKGVCRGGHPNENRYFCLYWNTNTNNCSFVEKGQRLAWILSQAEALLKKPVKTSPPTVTPVPVPPKGAGGK